MKKRLRCSVRSICTWMAISKVLADSGYFDVEEIRIFLEQGDMITLPAGIYHHFTLDEKNSVEAT